MLTLILTCFCKFYLFLFPILSECTFVKCHCQQCQWYIYRARKLNHRQRAKRVLGHLVKLGQCVKFGQRAKSRQRSGHKAIRKKLRNLFNLNSIKANLKLKQTTTVGQLSTRDPHRTRVNWTSAPGHRPVSQLCHRQRAKINQSNIKLQYLHQNLRHLTLF